MENKTREARRRLTLVQEDDAAPTRKTTRDVPLIEASGEWKVASADFILAVRAELEETTARFYATRLNLLSAWACEVANDGNGVDLTAFKARHLRQYMQYRATALVPSTGLPISDATRRHDAVAARRFLEFCHKEGYIETNPVADYQLPRASRTSVPCPSDEDVAALLKACVDRWTVALNHDALFIHKAGRAFFAKRNYAILAGLVTTGCRIGEMLSLLLDDIDIDARTVHFKNTKGNQDRIVPFEPSWGESVAAWLRARPSKSASPTLFVTEYGTRIDPEHFRRQFYKDRAFANLPHIRLHDLRHYAITQISRSGLREAQQIAGHKSLSTTQIYIHTDGDRMREVQAAAQPLGRILLNARSQKQRKKKLI